MGVYLSEPNVTKNTKLGSNQHLSFVSVEMQGINWLSVGWRKTMEDATVHILDLGDGNSLFAVFDGHGGTH